MQLAVWARTVDHTVTSRYAMGGFAYLAPRLALAQRRVQPRQFIAGLSRVLRATLRFAVVELRAPLLSPTLRLFTPRLLALQLLFQLADAPRTCRIRILERSMLAVCCAQRGRDCIHVLSQRGLPSSAQLGSVLGSWGKTHAGRGEE